MTTSEAASLTGYSQEYIRDCIRTGKLSAEHKEDLASPFTGFRYDISPENLQTFIQTPKDSRGWKKGKKRGRL